MLATGVLGRASSHVDGVTYAVMMTHIHSKNRHVYFFDSRAKVVSKVVPDEATGP